MHVPSVPEDVDAEHDLPFAFAFIWLGTSGNFFTYDHFTSAEKTFDMLHGSVTVLSTVTFDFETIFLGDGVHELVILVIHCFLVSA